MLGLACQAISRYETYNGKYFSPASWAASLRRINNTYSERCILYICSVCTVESTANTRTSSYSYCVGIWAAFSARFRTHNVRTQYQVLSVYLCGKKCILPASNDLYETYCSRCRGHRKHFVLETRVRGVCRVSCAAPAALDTKHDRQQYSSSSAPDSNSFM